MELQYSKVNGCGYADDYENEGDHVSGNGVVIIKNEELATSLDY